jgi:antitoxin component HigA of HigAB toxin-antitoxin module
MTHALDPTRLADDRDYVAALDELEDLMLSDPDTPAGRRFDELVLLIEDYEARHWPAEVPRVQQPVPRYAQTLVFENT